MRLTPGPVIAALLIGSLAMSPVAEGPRSADAANAVDDNPDPRTGGRLYAATSLFNQAISANPELDPLSTDYVRMLSRSKSEKGFVLSVKEWTVPAYFAEPGTARHDVRISGKPPGAHYDRNFVHNVRRIMHDVPIPDNARPDPMEDGHLSVIDPATRCEYDLYAAKRTATGWTAKWANVTSTADSGIYPFGLSTRGTGFAPLAGMIWPAELRNRRIDHALMFAYPYTRSGGPMSPATAGDGKTALATALPQGARVQLDPALDLGSLKLTAYERTIAEALQRYGMYLGDTGGALALYAVSPQSFATNPYAGLLPDEPYVFLNKIPVGRFRVLKTGPQLSQTPLFVVPSLCARIEVVG